MPTVIRTYRELLLVSILQAELAHNSEDPLVRYEFEEIKAAIHFDHKGALQRASVL
jgi:hypothetical protein